MTLPESVLSKAENPIIEDFAAPLLRQELPGVNIWTLIPSDLENKIPGVLVRKDLGPGINNSDPRGFTEEVYLQIECFTSDPDGDLQGAQLAEAVRVVFRNAWLKGTVLNNTWINRFRMPAEPNRKADFADSAGPVQYADLPQGYWRYQIRLNFLVRHNVSS